MDKVTIEKLQEVAAVAQSEDVREWAAYRRDIRRRRRNQRWQVVIVTVALVAGVVAWVACCIVGLRNKQQTRTELIEVLEGGVQ
jgi:hypothetical protein